MALMEFLTANLLNTTTLMTMQAANTGTAAYAFDRNISLGFTSVNYNSTTASVISITFPQATVISNVMLQNHNLRDFRIYYNSVTANSIIATTTNSATSTYTLFASVTVNSIDIQMNNTITGSSEKAFGEFVVAERRLQFVRNPSTENYIAAIKRKQIIHEMPDGGVKVYNIRDKFNANLKWQFITDAFRSSLLTEYNRALPIYFVPFPTTTGWSGDAYEVLVTGDFDFRYGENSKTQGWNGGLTIRQTAGG